MERAVVAPGSNSVFSKNRTSCAAFAPNGAWIATGCLHNPPHYLTDTCCRHWLALTLFGRSRDHRLRIYAALPAGVCELA